MAEIGQVTEVVGDLVSVKLQRHDACDHCNACLAGVETEEMILEAENLCQADVGDLVGISLEESNFLLAVIIMYIIPLFGLLIGLGVGYLVGSQLGVNEEIMSLLFGFMLLGITYLTIRKNEDKFHTRRFRPMAINIVKKHED
ncbi:SoxR reducing system RseC family protein [Petrocella sp. FN5]|uniref:SoxR reducing system RseC family protein n=1 Tax=Petrocella sp. FN5 TaxID=3032002 RepID=UPI0023D9B335|nr:SoxR reducing system RseC family protein [Petrocella sp. FN5]MDF1617783.1 SoxR reducing system RseC family protein [Petrocella sp. FN5]